MSLVPVRNVWLMRQQNLKGPSPSVTDDSKLNRNASSKATSPPSIMDVANNVDEAWPQVNVNSPSKPKEKSREKNVTLATTNGIVSNSSPKKSDKGKLKWVPTIHAEASAPSLPSNVGSSPLSKTSNVTQSLVPPPTSSSVTTLVPDDFPDLTTEVALNAFQIEQAAEKQGLASTSVPTPLQPEPLPEPPLKQYSPHSRPTSPSYNQLITPQSYPLFPESPYPYQLHPYPVYDNSTTYPCLPYASTSSSAQYPPYPSEHLSYIFPGQFPVPVPLSGQPNRDPMYVAGGAATVFGDLEPSHERRLPPFGVGCVSRKGKGKRKDIAQGGVTNQWRRRRRSLFAVSSWRSSCDHEVVDLTPWSDIEGNVEFSGSGFGESEDHSQKRYPRRWSFFWDGARLVDVSQYHSAPVCLQQSHHRIEGPGYTPYYPYPYYQHPLQAHPPPYPLPFQPAAPLHYPSIYSHSYSHPQQQQQSIVQQPFPVYPPFLNPTQPIYSYLQPPLNSESENAKEVPDEGIPIPSANTTTILVSASPNNTESDSATSHASSSSTKTKNLLGTSSSDSSTTASSAPSEESASGNKLPPLSALPTLNNLPTLDTIPTPVEGRNELARGPQDSATSHSHLTSSFTLNPTHDPFVPSALGTNLPSRPFVDERRNQHDLDQDDESFLRVRDFRHFNSNSWASEPGSERVQPQMQSDEQGEREIMYARQQPMIHNGNDEAQLDGPRTRQDGEFQRGVYRPNGRDDWRGGRGFRPRGFGRGRGRAGFRGRGYGFSHGFAPPVVPRDAYEMPLGTSNGIGGGTAPPRYRRGRGVGLFIPPNLDMQHLHHHNASPSQITPPHAFSTSPYSSHPPTAHPSPLIPQTSLHHTPPSQYHAPAQIPAQAPPSTWTAQHPWPPPLTPLANIPVQLDELRYRLLGQLEYYLSAENMFKDMWLRRKMSSEGWIPLPVIMTFNRIRQLTDNLDLVKEVLAFSQHVEVLDNGGPERVKVRMRDGAWERYVLPPPVVVKMEAPPDKTVHPVVNGGALHGHSLPPAPHINGDITLPGSAKIELPPATASDESEVEEDPDSDEDDVVFVMGSEGGGWSRTASGERGA
ncbi:hypothetical protein E1B28_008354 [Marasmius oreades]|uniref:HTH La-type RNA-binding domain-containing protein n=1 Tax=Marasmius oreades TaxID=181124 RepID=A0A9P7RYC8_9AGAR|nr:uncharacterized protein E1B28_008354 [Marasmius oreades]KAG7091965.1 hypothetical protein E1B28_008354 [Marasmius oreades]